MSELELKGKTGIVTGASSGIGFQIANVLAEAGPRLCRQPYRRP